MWQWRLREDRAFQPLPRPFSGLATQGSLLWAHVRCITAVSVAASCNIFKKSRDWRALEKKAMTSRKTAMYFFRVRWSHADFKRLSVDTCSKLAASSLAGAVQGRPL